MSRQVDLAEQASLTLIAADAKLFRDLVFNPHFEPIRFMVGLAFMPPLSMFVYESAEYVKREYPTASEIQALLQSHKDLLRRSRLRLKLLDDSNKSYEEILDSARELVAINNSWFQDHRGVLAPLKRLLQRDLGVYFMQNEAFCTTHVGFLNMGLTKEELSASSLSLETLGHHMHDISVDLGRYVAALLQGLGIDVHAAYDAHEVSLPPIQFRDLKSERFYTTMAPQVAPHQSTVSLLLTLILSQVNTARIFVPKIAVDNEVAALKIRLVSLFHAVSSLQKLLDQHKRTPLLHSAAAEQITDMLGTPSVRAIRKKGYQRLRNNLVHYKVDESIALHLSPNLPLFGLVEANVSGKSLTDVANDVELGLSRVSDVLHALLPKSLTPKGTL